MTKKESDMFQIKDENIVSFLEQLKEVWIEDL